MGYSPTIINTTLMIHIIRMLADTCTYLKDLGSLSYNKIQLILPKKKPSIQSQTPPFLLQSRDELVHRFLGLRFLEDERLHDSVVNGATSPWSVHDAASQLSRNRYINVFPYDSTRVKLQVEPGFSDYINASNIVVDLKEKALWSKKYIASQGPLENTHGHFWQMIFQMNYDTIVIVMVTPLVERNTIKCSRYWPETVGQTYEMSGDEGFDTPLEVTLKSTNYSSSNPQSHTYYEHKLTLSDKHGKTKTVYQLYYDKWADCSKPSESDSIISLIMRANELNSEDAPLVVHCSAGVGRTGTFVVLDYLLTSCKLFVNNFSGEESDEKTDTSVPGENYEEQDDMIYEIVSELRQQRMRMVESKTQFVFLYNTARNIYEQNRNLHAVRSNIPIQ